MKVGMRLRSSLGLESIFLRCAAIMALTTVAVAGVMAVQTMSLVDALARQTIADRAESLAETMASSLVAPLRFGVDVKIVDAAHAAFERAGDMTGAALVFDATGALHTATGPDGFQSPLSELAIRALDAGETVTAANGLNIAIPVRSSADAEPIGVAVIGLEMGSGLAGVASQKVRIAVVACVIFVAMMSATLLLLRHILGKPLGALRDAVSRVRDGDYEKPVPLTERKDEIGGIARDLAGMIGRLADGKTAQAERERSSTAQLKVVTALGEGLDALAGGDLSNRLADAFPEEYDALRLNYNRALQTLEDSISTVAGNAASITNGINEIAQASDDLSRRTETQAATLEQTAAALEEMVASVRSAAANAGHADERVGTARQTATRNDEVMQSAMNAMSEIEKSSEQIGDIITVIDDIAFQTNLLALNAGVEAARAGSSGKGFAVVASEVRALAQRSSDAARQIKDLITGSTAQVKSGVKLVEEANGALQEMVEQVDEIAKLVSGIAQASSEQAQGLNEISAGVTSLDQVTQQNAAMVEESTAAAHLLRQDVEELTQKLLQFETASEPSPEKTVPADRSSGNPAHSRAS